jgi:hypothetical protein
MHYWDMTVVTVPAARAASMPAGTCKPGGLFPPPGLPPGFPPGLPPGFPPGTPGFRLPPPLLEVVTPLSLLEFEKVKLQEPQLRPGGSVTAPAVTRSSWGSLKELAAKALPLNAGRATRTISTDLMSVSCCDKLC